METDQPPQHGANDAAAEEFVASVASSLKDGSFVRLTMGCWRGSEVGLQKISARVVEIKGARLFSMTASRKTRDTITNIALEDAPETVRNWLRSGFKAARLFTLTSDVQIDWNKTTGFQLTRSNPSSDGKVHAGHDRVKRRLVPSTSPFLSVLGITGGDGRIIPSMSHKWKQINKFVEILDHAIADSALADQKNIVLADFGAGKGYLTFAAHHHLQATLQRSVVATGIERRADLVAFCNQAVAKLGLAGLEFRQGDIHSYNTSTLDLLIALHACDTATDEAIALGIRAGAAVIMCAPCCHKELRPQIIAPKVLRPVLRFGIHAAMEAEMLTDALRALLMESRGYRTQIFEFVSTEHTDKNRMILGVRAQGRQDEELVAAQIVEIKDFYGIKEQRLEQLLRRCSTGTCDHAG